MVKTLCGVFVEVRIFVKKIHFLNIYCVYKFFLLKKLGIYF